MINLRELIRSKIEAAGKDVELCELLAAVKAEIDDFEAAFDVLAMAYLRKVIGQIRHETLYGDGVEEPAAGVPAPAADRAIPIGRSKRSIGFAAWKSKLDVLVSIDGDGTMKRLGACSAVEVQMLSEQYLRRAKEHGAYAVWYGRIAEAMRAAGVAAVADLPEATLQPLLAKAAA